MANKPRFTAADAEIRVVQFEAPEPTGDDKRTPLESILERANDCREDARSFRNQDLWDAAASCDGKASGLFVAAKILREAEPQAPDAIDCPTCNGYGVVGPRMIADEPCCDCGGTGRIQKAPDAIEVELPPLSPCAVADAANGYFEDALEQREEQLKAEIVAKNALEALQRVHLTALRIVSAALGHPYKNERGKSCIDLANYAAKEIRTLHERSEKAEKERDEAKGRLTSEIIAKNEANEDRRRAESLSAHYRKERDAALLYGKNRKRDQLKAELDELRKRYENITVERDDAEIERDRLSAELSELRKQGTFADFMLGRCLPMLDILRQNEQARELRKDIVAYASSQLKRTPPKK